MRGNIKIYITLILLQSISFVSSQSSNSDKTIKISGSRFTYPLINKWIEEYSKQNPDIQFKLIQSNSQDNGAQLRVFAYQFERNVGSNKSLNLLQVARYAQLPYSNINNPVLGLAGRRGFTKREINNLFFETLDYDDHIVVQRQKYQVNVYSKENQSCLSGSLASHFGLRPADIRGSKIFGDEKFLLKAVELDSLGVAYNTLSAIFDIASRKINPGISLLPLDISKDDRRILSGNLDDVISVLESSRIETVPIETIGFDLSQVEYNTQIKAFISWILDEGQKFVHQQGFLRLDQEILAQQAARLSEVLLGQNK